MPLQSKLAILYGAMVIALKDKGIIQSMLRKDNSFGNAPIENFFDILKKEMYYDHEYEFETSDQLKKTARDYFKYSNTKHIKVKLKGLTPYKAWKQAILLS